MSQQTQIKDQASAAGQVAEADSTPRAQVALQWVSERGIFVFTAALVIFATVFVNGFASSANLVDVFHRAAPIGIVALGMTFVVISGNYLDLSVVAQVATSAVLLIAISNSYGMFMAIIAMLGVALLYALINGVAVGYFKANAVIVTLATTYMGLGILRWLSGGSIFFGPADGPIRAIGQVRVFGLPISALVLIAMTLILAFILTRTTFGFQIRAYGSNEKATRLAGVNTPRIIIGAFLITSLSAAVAGFVLATFSNTAVSSMSQGFDFGALAAIIIGGTSVFGGRGSIFRTLLGVLFVSILTNLMVLSGLGFGWQQTALGALIAIAVSVDTLARRTAKS